MKKQACLIVALRMGLLVALSLVTGCGENATVVQSGGQTSVDDDDDDDDDGDGGGGNVPEPDDNDDEDDDDGVMFTDVEEPDAEEPDDVEPEPVDPCENDDCGPGQRCEAVDDEANCVDLSCDDLDCSDTEVCEPHDQGGNVCVDISCEEDVDCELAEYCSDAGICAADVCTPAARECSDQELLICSSNGGALESPYSCGSPAYFETLCAQDVTSAACTCEGDWDCPGFTSCEVSQCVGTGVEPTCTLPPSDFSETQPAVEMHWGGDAFDNDAAHDGTGETAPWPESSHTWATPIVINLDDDNGDGAVNELDFPEIIFTTYAADPDNEINNYEKNNGIVRAIHGGGPNRGKDFFASCGSLLWTATAPIDDACGELADAQPQSAVAAGDLDGDEVPEIVHMTEGTGFRILNNRGETILTYAEEAHPIQGNERGAGISIANLDHAGLPELIVSSVVYKLNLDVDGNLFVEYRLDGAGTNAFNDNTGPLSCVADVHETAGMEILAGSTLYAMPAALDACATPPCAATLDVIWDAALVNTDVALTENDGFCAIADVWGPDFSAAPGPDNPPGGEEGTPEAILIADGNLIILDAATGTLIDQRSLGGQRGGAPNVDDFDGDGFMEIASALQDFYVVVDLQEPTANDGSCPSWPTVLPRAAGVDQDDNPNIVDDGLVRNPGGEGGMSLDSGAVVPGTCETDADCDAAAVCNTQSGTCVCLHNGWQRDSDDDSSRATSSSVFDFNGDGAAEVLYNDECNFRVFDGVTGVILFSEISRSRTWLENPVVADVDNDGNAEAVTVANTEQNGRCDDDPDDPAGPNGLLVWGDPQDTWVEARRVWNQHSYHVTNITEGGLVPLHEPESWREFNGRTYNTYRSQPRNYGVAPDLTVVAVSIFSPDAACGVLSETIQIVFEVRNEGDIRVGPGVQVAFFGSWDGDEEALMDAAGEPLMLVLDSSIEPGRSVIQSVTFKVDDQDTQTALPDTVRVLVDSGGADGSEFGAERECNEDNNDLDQDVDPGEARPDLSIEVGSPTVNCTTRVATVPVTVINNGAADAEGVVVQVFAGNPAQGGSVVAEITLDDPIPSMGEVSIEVEVEDVPKNREITYWGSVDPGNLIEECNEGDNTDPADNPIECEEILIVK